MRRAFALALVAACGGSNDDEPRENAPPPATAATPDQTLAALRAYIANRDAPEQLEKLLAPRAIVTNGDPTAGTPIFGRDIILASRKKRAAIWKERCSIEVELAAVGEAVGIALCTGTMAMKVAPLERHRALRHAYEVTLDANGLVAQATLWVDTLRSYRQLGAELDVEARPDEPTGSVVTAVARGDEEEAGRDRRARELIAALDRRDLAAAERVFGDDYVEHSLHEPGARTRSPGVYLRDELGECEVSNFRVQGTLAARDWVAVRFGKSCRIGESEAYANHLWLLRFDGARVREGWRLDARYEVQRQLGTLDVPTLAQRLRAVGL